jgi:hypothetical protein
MPYFKNNDVNILFIHIPKTGGSSVENYFYTKFSMQQDNKSLYGFIDPELKLNENMIINSSLQHITYDQMIEYNNVFNIDLNNIKIITIVRNPYERIISDLFFYGKINVNTSKEDVFDMLQDYLVSTDYDNHNLPQHYFITTNNKTIIPNIHILHTETLTNDMKDLGYEDFDLLLNVNKFNVDYYDYLNNKSIEVINAFFHFDFILFGYVKISVV